ncbi:MAG: HAMP domain-containing sensor histidine kinase [Candidatus Cloacimonetes bacterium]|nr:HAMP domain-containing histidine kinase [Candidatus Cloacimonadota bacterium]MDY0298269.1 HAMP domain-containing sensor histidine kinase [Candidatus Cloacimonadaceae bacterium]MCB5278728.1 HAMP domain-containing histidine kinase [Candidatus Cloacimonadota bacterium]MCK9332132.1 HAMP domain-containing histidine kinase [Candidatus Cloacimonadota bacterium]MDD2209807.1 HAMP domain-containing sensor histidine kinase [Candidatus Cloacimonadota bacterium]
MKQVLRNSISTGNQQKRTNRFHVLRLYLVLGSLFIFVFFALYTQVLIQKAKQEQEFVPRIFAKYIAYTDGYLRLAEKYAQLLTEVSSKYLQFTAKRDFQQQLWDYISTEFMSENPIPIIVTDENLMPLVWKNVSVSTDSLYEDLSHQSRLRLGELLGSMIQTPLVDDGRLTGYAFYSKPISFEQFIRNIDYEIIVTDRNREPLYWRNVGIDESSRFHQLDIDDQFSLLSQQSSMKEIPLSNEADSLGYIYFTNPQSLSYIRYIIILELFLALMVVFFGSYGLLLLKRSEKDTLWVSLAKETAHQFGTPITSLMGWIDYMAESPAEGVKRPDMSQILDFMRADLKHLRNIASRFGKVGSITKLEAKELNSILYEIVEYFRNRMPHLGSRIDIHLISKIEHIEVMMDVELIKWTLENLIKNCVDAMSGKGGNIIITATQKYPFVYVHIRDEGKGIPRGHWKKVFDPGVTSKTRGWGLGLSLAKRIIEEYHQGKIRVVESALNEGTTIEIRLYNAKHYKK